jgi:hypothetical protein
MKISKLALIALLGGALMAFGCSDDSSTSGAAGGAGGEGGTGGTGGVPEGPAGVYSFTCTLGPDLPIPLPVTITINADDPGFTDGVASDLVTLLNYSVAPSIIGALPGLAPDAMVAGFVVTVSVAGGTPTEIAHTAPGLPFAPVAEFDSDEVTTAVTPDAGAAEIGLSVTALAATINGLGDLVAGGEIVLEAGSGDCTPVEAVPGSGPLTFDVAAAE